MIPTVFRWLSRVFGAWHLFRAISVPKFLFDSSKFPLSSKCIGTEDICAATDGFLNWVLFLFTLPRSTVGKFNVWKDIVMANRNLIYSMNFTSEAKIYQRLNISHLWTKPSSWKLWDSPTPWKFDARTLVFPSLTANPLQRIFLLSWLSIYRTFLKPQIYQRSLMIW